LVTIRCGTRVGLGQFLAERFTCPVILLRCTQSFGASSGNEVVQDVPVEVEQGYGDWN
jgi:hypothetical protein